MNPRHDSYIRRMAFSTLKTPKIFCRLFVYAAVLMGSSCESRVLAKPTYILERMYFGLSTPTGLVTARDFDQFIAASVTPRFPEGLTELTAKGQWRNSHGDIIAEPSMIVEIVMIDTQANHVHIQNIIDDYKKKFAQESVMLIEERPGVSF
jgi:hypothetical protein